jgi:hypothetical protein
VIVPLAKPSKNTANTTTDGGAGADKRSLSVQDNERGTTKTTLTEPASEGQLYAAPPMEDEDDAGMSEGEQRNLDHDNLRPGAFPIAGINQPQISQQSFLYTDPGATELEEEAKENVDEVTLPSGVVAEAVDDDQLFRETLTRLQLEVVEAEIVNVEEEGDVVDQDAKSMPRRTKRRTIAAATMVLAVVVISVVLITVLVSRSSNNYSKQQTQPPATAKPTAPHQPTAAPVPRLEVFRSVILDYNVSSNQDLNQSGTPQNDALNWLVNIDNFLNASSTSESIIDRYVLAVIYYADGGYQWSNQSNFLTFESICAWHDTPDNGTGAFCTTLRNVSNGKVIYLSLCDSFIQTTATI